MSQVSDVSIANQGFSAFRTELNNILGAINTTHIGSSAPSSLAQGSLWIDTSAGATGWILKLYDGSDHIALGTINSTANTVDWTDSSVTFDIVNDTTPQLGGDLDTNDNNIIIDDAHNILDENSNEQLTFQTTASAVNNSQLTNAATGNAPEIAAVGGDSNIDLNINPKGIGRVTLGASKIQQIAEKATVSATAATGTINYDVITQAVLYYTSDASGNYTLNIRGDGSNTLNSIMDTGESITVAHLVTNGGTAYYNNAVQVDGSGVTPEWQGGAAPTAGNTNSVDVYSYTVFKTGDAAFTVFASQTQFA